MSNFKNKRNIAIIAHVDHGKTTLIGQILLWVGKLKSEGFSNAIVDNNAIEKERGITILAKCTSFEYKDIKYNIVDTPGHADFGGEVERVLSMVDGVLLLVDSSEGPMPQTKFVLSKALAAGLKPIVMINKVDRSDARTLEVLHEVFDLFIALGANDEQIDFPVLYGSGRDGWASNDMSVKKDGFEDVFDVLSSSIPSPKIIEREEFSMLTTILSSDLYVGRLLIGKVYSGRAKVGDTLKGISLDGRLIENIKLTKLFGFSGVDKVQVDYVEAGDIVAIAGAEKISVSDTICSIGINQAIESTKVDPPTMAVTISVNDSPLAGTEGTKVTSRMILDRLEKEAETNVAISLKISPVGDSFVLGGRGELQLGIIIENMRREGFELSVSRPRVLFKKGENGQVLEPIDQVIIDVDEGYSGTVIEKLSLRKGELIDMKTHGNNKARIIFKVPVRGLIGYQTEFRSDTRGEGIMNRIFDGYEPFRGEIAGRKKGVLISNSNGESVAYSLANLEERGILFIGSGVKVYEGMIIGENSRDNDLDVNPVKSKQLTNIRAAGNDDAIRLTPPKEMTLEDIISYIQDDEEAEVTPKNIRIRKKELVAGKRKKSASQVIEFEE